MQISVPGRSYIDIITEIIINVPAFSCYSMQYQAVYDPLDPTSPVSEGPKPEETAQLFLEGAILMSEANTPNEFHTAADKFARVVSIGNPALFYDAVQAQVDCAINAGDRGPRTIDDKF